MTAPEDLIERIRLRLEDSFIGIGAAVSGLPEDEVERLTAALTRKELLAVETVTLTPESQ